MWLDHLLLGRPSDSRPNLNNRSISVIPGRSRYNDRCESFQTINWFGIWVREFSWLEHSTLTNPYQPQKEVEISTQTNLVFLAQRSRNAGVENSSQNLENCIEIKSSKLVYHPKQSFDRTSETIKRLSGQVTKG